MSCNNFLIKIKDFISLPQFIKYGHFLIVTYCLVAALSIAVSQIVLGALFLYWIALLFTRKASLKVGNDSCFSSEVFCFYIIPAAAWIFVSCISAVFGVSPARAFKEIYSTALFFCLPLVVYSLLWWSRNEGLVVIDRIKFYLIVLIIGQSIASLHSILSTALGWEIPPRIPGAVTESGQLVLVIPAALALVAIENLKLNYRSFKIQSLCRYILIAALVCSMLVFSWPHTVAVISNHVLCQILAFAVVPVILLALYYIENKDLHFTKKWFNFKNLRFLLLSFLIVALIVNLKRGPWLGILVATSVIGYFYSRRILAFSMVIALVTFFLFTPVRERLFKGSEHFSIEGGRKQMWAIGADLILRYPIGLGPDNARYMRKLDPTLPELHRHMHNNLLNVTVETGWLGVGCYVWWLYQIIALGFLWWFKGRKEKSVEAKEKSILALFLATALLGWQCAGVVEYNFGDGEIRTIALFFMGLLLSLGLIDKSQRSLRDC